MIFIEFIGQLVTRSAANDAVSKFPSMQLNEKRLELEKNIMASLQNELDTAEKGVFTVDRVNVTNIITDPTVEQSIQRIADTENQKIIAKNQLESIKYARNQLQKQFCAINN